MKVTVGVIGKNEHHRNDVVAEYTMQAAGGSAGWSPSGAW